MSMYALNSVAIRILAFIALSIQFSLSSYSQIEGNLRVRIDNSGSIPLYVAVAKYSGLLYPIKIEGWYEIKPNELFNLPIIQGSTWSTYDLAFAIRDSKGGLGNVPYTPKNPDIIRSANTYYCVPRHGSFNKRAYASELRKCGENEVKIRFSYGIMVTGDKSRDVDLTIKLSPQPTDHVSVYLQEPPKQSIWKEDQNLKKDLLDKGKKLNEIFQSNQQNDDTDINSNQEKLITLPGGVEMEFVWIPPGTFIMGSPENEKDRYDDETRHRVTLTQGFWMGKYEVTQAQWEAVMNANPSRFESGNRPVESVSWNDCQDFIAKLNRLNQGTFRLPTEAEWEYAYRAGTTTRFYWGEDRNESDIDRYAWYNGNSGDRTHEVGQKRSNPWGLYDMSGNVWEWCADWYGDYPSGPQVDPKGQQSGRARVQRGGSWLSYALYCRSASRNRSYPGYGANYIGLRILLSRT